jgi:hypothetical protein
MTGAAWLLDRAEMVPDLFVDVMESGERRSIVEVGQASAAAIAPKQQAMARGVAE